MAANRHWVLLKGASWVITISSKMVLQTPWVLLNVVYERVIDVFFGTASNRYGSTEQLSSPTDPGVVTHLQTVVGSAGRILANRGQVYTGVLQTVMGSAGASYARRPSARPRLQTVVGSAGRRVSSFCSLSQTRLQTDIGSAVSENRHGR